MKFGTLEIENFSAITEATIQLSDRGLVLVQGVNKDDTSAESNGAGKSSVFDALCWALFDETARGISGDAVVNWVASKGTRVAVTIHDNHDTYRIARHRKHKTGKNRLTLHHIDAAGVEKDLTDGTDKLTQAKVGKIIGCSLDVFVASIYAGQDKMPDLPAMTDKTLKLVVEEAAGIQLIEEALTAARKRLATCKAEQDQHATNLSHLEGTLENQKDALTFDCKDEAEWETSRNSRILEGTTAAKTLKTEFENNQALRAQIDRAALQADLDAEKAKIAAVADEQTKLTELNTSISREEAKGESLRRELQIVRNMLTDCETKLAGVEHQVGCPCTACGRPITENEIATAKTLALSSLESQKRVVIAKAQQVQASQKATQKLTSERDAFQASMTDLSASLASVSSLEAKLRDTDALDRSTEQLKAALLRKVDEVKAIRAEANPHAGKTERTKAQIKRTEELIEATKVKITEGEEALAVAQGIVDVYGPAGVRAHILDEVTPFLNTQTAKYLATLSDGNIDATWTTLTQNSKGQLAEKFSIEVTNAHGGKVFGAQSGGEKRKVRLAAALALQDLVARRAAKPIELFIGDEIDNALDAPGLERLTAVLEEKARERGSVFVISHSDLKDWVPQVMTVTKDGGKTTITEGMV